ncbi:MAG: hypothetical protein ABI904_22765 [Chloroflexota bacterium]
MLSETLQIIEKLNDTLVLIWRDLVKKVGKKTAQTVVITITMTLAFESIWFALIAGWVIYIATKGLPP